MNLLEYKPASDEFDGYVKLKMLSYPERMRIYRECKFDLKDGGINDTTFEGMEHLYDHLKERVEEMHLVHKASDTTISSIDELGYYAEGTVLINEMGAKLLNGMSLGNG